MHVHARRQVPVRIGALNMQPRISHTSLVLLVTSSVHLVAACAEGHAVGCAPTLA